MPVIIDSIDGENIVARSHADAPEIDGSVFIEATDNVSIGDIVQVKIADSNEYDLFGSTF